LLRDLHTPEAGRTQFWMRSHLALSWAAGICGLSIHHTIVKYGVRSSPLAYADAGPCGIPSKTNLSRSKLRRSVPAARLREHAGRLLALPALRDDRCALIVVSGRIDEYAPFYEVLTQQTAGRIPLIQVPFFGQNAKSETIGRDIRGRLKAEGFGELVQDLVTEWGRQVGVVEDRSDGKTVLLGHQPCPLCS
jgi:hypothetical protein